MRKVRNDRGGSNLSLLFTILIAVFLVYEAKQFGPLLLAQFEFHDAVVEAAKFSRDKDPSTVQNEVLARASALSLPISREMIKVTRQPWNTRIQVSYQLSAEWAPGRLYSWTVVVDEESVLF
ncbi:MAG TPA: hypothetical protein VEK15_09140 [Vicinamibacteria bacterium]|nr:hypothetical protein [Vicinamibacteria bacterium]